LWDPTYPTYSVPKYAWINPDLAKSKLIARYVREYNGQLEALAVSMPRQVMLVRTDELAELAVQKSIFDFAGASGEASNIKLNVGSFIDAKSIDVKF
jgi:hypothetical protein